MAHIRQQIREKAKVIISGAINRPVFVNRAKQISPKDLPCVIVTTDQDDVEDFIINRHSREITMMVKVFEKSFTDVDDLVDDLCVKIENAFENQESIQADEIKLESTSIDIFGDGDQPIAVATMRYTARFLGVSDPEQLI